MGVGHGAAEFPFLALFRCDLCRSVGSTWIYPDRIPRCSLCYHDAVTLLPEGQLEVHCPKCGEPGRFQPVPGEWR